MGRKTIRIPDKLSDRIEKDAKERGISVNDWHKEASEHLLICKKAETIQALKFIPLKYAGKCLKCGKSVPAGNWAYWGRGVGIICIDCFIQRYGDKATVKMIMKQRDLTWKIKALQKELDETAEELRKFNFYEKIEAMHQGYREIRKLIVAYLKTGFDKPEQEKKAIDELERLCKKEWAVIEEIDRFMRVPLKKPKKKKTKEAH